MITDIHPPTVNFLAGPYIDRRTEAREQLHWEDAARNDLTTRFILAVGLTQLVISQDTPCIAFVGAEHPLVQSTPSEHWLLLGWFQGSRCVLVQLETIHSIDTSTALITTAEARFQELRPLVALLNEAEAGLLAYARAISYWQQRHRYCGLCGSKTSIQRAGHVMHCSNVQCETVFFPRIDPAIIILVTNGECALLGRQRTWTTGRYSTVAGFVEPGESLEDAVAREVLEETHVAVTAVSYHSSQPWPFPSSLMLGFMATAREDSIARSSSELEDVRWFTRTEISNGFPILPPKTSISFRLIEAWFNTDAQIALSDLPHIRR